MSSRKISKRNLARNFRRNVERNFGTNSAKNFWISEVLEKKREDRCVESSEIILYKSGAIYRWNPVILKELPGVILD